MNAPSDFTNNYAQSLELLSKKPRAFKTAREGYFIAWQHVFAFLTIIVPLSILDSTIAILQKNLENSDSLQTQTKLLLLDISSDVLWAFQLAILISMISIKSYKIYDAIVHAIMQWRLLIIVPVVHTLLPFAFMAFLLGTNVAIHGISAGIGMMTGSFSLVLALALCIPYFYLDTRILYFFPALVINERDSLFDVWKESKDSVFSIFLFILSCAILFLPLLFLTITPFYVMEVDIENSSMALIVGAIVLGISQIAFAYCLCKQYEWSRSLTT